MIKIKPAFVLIFSLFLFAACEEEVSCGDSDSLSCFLQTHAERSQSKNLRACAAGGQEGFLDDPALPVSVFFYPIPGATEFRYFETDDLSANPDDFSAFKEITLDGLPVFNGYLHRFTRSASTEDTWSRVVYFTPDSVHISNAIRLKDATKPSEFAPELLNIDLSNPLEPIFSWTDGRTPENEIYFHVVSDENGTLISGTYTFDKNFQFYNLDNVVLNIRDVDPAPTLTSGETYNFTLMGVSLDNWVNLIVDTTFVAE
ncbi:MAG: hypothetical protein AAGD28_04085 [Bacteroidota bacterium]